MSALRSALEEWVVEDVELLHLDQLADDLVEIEVVSGLLEAERLRRLNSFEDRSGPDAFGYPSLTAFLKDRCRMASGRAHRLVAKSRMFRSARATFRAWTGNHLSTDQAAVLLDQATSLPGAFADGEERLVEIVEDLNVSDTRRVIEYWRQSVDGPDTVRDEIAQHELRGISLSETLGGMGHIEGWITPTALPTLRTALDALMPPPARGDNRTARQRRHDALEDLARDFLDHGDTPTVGGEKPHINVICDIEALAGVAGGQHETEDGHVLTVASLRALACDSSVSRIVLGPNSEIIDVGRRTRVIPAALRRAIVARDRHCTWKGCDRPARWCDVHHDVAWALGGCTDPANCRLLCRFHHVLTHLLEGRAPPSPPVSSPNGPRIRTTQRTTTAR
jgi:hypothetical protein